MGHNWIIDVLADVKAFAEQNNLPLLAGQLDDTLLVAHAEVVTGMSAGTVKVAGGHGRNDRELAGTVRVGN